jgi:hypothetical protein
METPLNFNRKKEIREEIRTTRPPPPLHTHNSLPTDFLKEFQLARPVR